jgi:adenylate kinase
MQRTLALIKPDATGKPWNEVYSKRVELPEGEEAPECAAPAWELATETRARDKRDEVLARIAKEGFTIVASKQVFLSKAEAEEFYAEHAGKPFFEGLTAFMSSGPTHALVLEKEGAIGAWRELMGPTNSHKARAASEEAHPLNEDLWTLRALFGTDGTHNATHGSDSPFSAWREIGLLFPELEPQVWERSVALILPHVLAAGRADAVVAALDAAEFVVVARARLAALPGALVDALLPPKYARAPEAASALEGECEAVLVEARGAVRKLRLLAGPPPSAALPSHLHAQFGASDAAVGVLAAPSAAVAEAFLPHFPEALPIEATLAVVKPGTADAHYRAILADIAQCGFTVLAEARRQLTREEAEAFYSEHAGRPFFPALTEYMASGPVVALALAKPGAIRTWRLLCGPTNTALARRDRPHSLRARYGVDGTRNAVHGSDAPASAARELRFYFPRLPLATTGTQLGGGAAIEYIKSRVVAEVYEPSRGHTVVKTVESVLVDALAELAKAKPSNEPAEAIRWLGEWLLENNPRRGVVSEARAPLVEEPAEEEAAAGGGGGHKLPPPRRSRALARGAPRDAAAAAPAAEAPPPKRTIVFVLGAPGSGKGTQCERIAAAFGYKHLSMGDLLRAEAESGSPIGSELKAIMARGELVSTALVLQIMKGAMEASGAQKFLLDGYPRALDQAVQFEAAIGPPSFVLSFEADEATLEARLLKRGESSGRADDNLESIRKRFSVFTAQSEAVIKFYGKLGLLRACNSLRPVEEVFGEVAGHFRPQTAWLLGGPGAGRSTMAARVTALGLGWHHLSTGDLCRAEAKSGSAEGEELATIMARGDGVPLPTVLRLVQGAIERTDPVGRYILDGGVRDLEMAVAFEGALGTPSFIVSLEAPDAVLLARAGGRAAATGAGAASGRRDEHAAVHRKQLADYHAATQPLIALYAAKALVRRIDAARPEEAVWRDVRRAFAPRAVFVLGAPGSGKGTQCARLAAEFGYVHLSAGDMVRCEVERGSAAGAAIASYAAEGKLVPAGATLGLLKAAIAASRAGAVLLDGFPRALDQALAFEGAIVEPACVLSLECPEDTARARCSASGGGGDFAQRYRTYSDVTGPVLDHYGVEGKVRSVDAGVGAEAVLAALRDVLRPAIVCVLGAPGSGKGTQCGRIAAAFGYTHLSMGEIMRAEVASGSAQGAALQATLAAGALVEDATVLQLLQAAMRASGSTRFLLDGFPRTAAQVALLRGAFGALPNFVLHFDGAPEVLKARVAAQAARASAAAAAGAAAGAAAPEARQDASPEAIAARFEAYKASEEPVLRQYGEQRLVRSLSSLPPPDTVFARVRRLFQPALVVLVRDEGCQHEAFCVRAGRELGYATLSVEALVREEVASGSPGGLQLAAAAAARRTPPMGPLLAVLERAMLANPAAQRFLLDGYPRLVSAGFPGVHDQVMAAEERLGAFKGAIVLSASLEARLARAGARVPGEVAVVKARADAFRRERAPVVAFFDKLGKSCAVDATSATPEDMLEAARPFME